NPRVPTVAPVASAPASEHLTPPRADGAADLRPRTAPPPRGALGPRPPLPTPSALRRRREHRSQRLLANRAVADALVSVAGLVGPPVRHPTGADGGRVL